MYRYAADRHVNLLNELNLSTKRFVCLLYAISIQYTTYILVNVKDVAQLVVVLIQSGENL